MTAPLAERAGASPAVSPEWREWLAENLLLGCDPEALERVLVAAGVAPELAKEALDAELAHPYFDGCQRIGQMQAKLEGLLDVYGTLYRHSGADREVPRHADLPARELFERYYFPNRPVVLEALAREWTSAESEAALRELLDRGPLPHGCVTRPKPGLEPRLQSEPAGSVTPLQPAPQNVLACQVRGRSRVKLVPAFALHRLPDAPGTVEVLLSAGDALFVPVGWGHGRHALEDGLTVELRSFATPEPNTRWNVPPDAAR
ncbi:MAG TPA: hypothetical protein VK420_11140 [Longimicrobium sp.]|nr:hypothetical protein [Longimicrobium sp.]